MPNISTDEMIQYIISRLNEDMTLEEFYKLLTDHHEAVIKEKKEKTSFGDNLSDFLAKFAGSWLFVILFCIILMGWILLNLALKGNAFDPYPFILMNLILSTLAAIQAPLIMMSQNRQEEKDRRRAENDYIVNLKSEFIIQDIYQKLDTLIKNQEIYLNELKNNN